MPEYCKCNHPKSEHKPYEEDETMLYCTVCACSEFRDNNTNYRKLIP